MAEEIAARCALRRRLAEPGVDDWLAVQRGRLDAAYLERWAARLGAEGQVPNALHDCRLGSISARQTTRAAI